MKNFKGTFPLRDRTSQNKLMQLAKHSYLLFSFLVTCFSSI